MSNEIIGSLFVLDKDSKHSLDEIIETLIKDNTDEFKDTVSKNVTVIQNKADSITNLYDNTTAEIKSVSNNLDSEISRAKNAESTLNSSISSIDTSSYSLAGNVNLGFKSFGTVQIDSTTLVELEEKVRYTNGCAGSCYISGGPYASDSIWYNFLYIPHRTGGNNGSVSGDNQNFGVLFLTPMTSNVSIIYKYKLIGNTWYGAYYDIDSTNIGSQSVSHASSADTATYASKPASGSSIITGSYSNGVLSLTGN